MYMCTMESTYMYTMYCTCTTQMYTHMQVHVYLHCISTLINPQRTCAARVTVVVLCVCPLVGNSLQKRLFVLKTLSHTLRATWLKIFVGFSLQPPHFGGTCTALPHCMTACMVGHFDFVHVAMFRILSVSRPYSWCNSGPA